MVLLNNKKVKKIMKRLNLLKKIKVNTWQVQLGNKLIGLLIQSKG